MGRQVRGVRRGTAVAGFLDLTVLEEYVRHRLVAKVAIAGIAGALVLAGCGSSEETGGAGDGKKEVVIGFSAPLTGGLSALGLGMRNSAQLAVDQANAANKIDGWTIKLDPQDDQGTASVGGQLAAKFASQEGVAGVVGPLNSSVAQQMQPILDAASIVLVSPANTNPTLTQGNDWAKGTKTRPFASYFRTATTDAIQGAFAAEFMYKDLGKRKVAVINDKKTYGAGLAAVFKTEFAKLGGTVVADEVVGEKDTVFTPVITRVKAAAPDAVYYGGEYPAAGPLSKQMKDAGLKVPLMGGDGIYSADFIKLGGTQVTGDVATSIGAPTETLPSAAKFVADYKAKGFPEPYEAYGASTFDATTAIIEALAKALPGKSKIDEETRKAVVAAMGSVSFDGVNGKTSFDAFGDTTNRLLTAYKVAGGKWVPARTASFTG